MNNIQTIGFKMVDSTGGGTCLQGYIDTSYADLVNCFGEPTHDGDGYKVDAEWVIKFDSGVVATIYNYKDGKNYNGPEGDAVEDITNWHVGGFEPDAVPCVEAAMAAYLQATCYQEPNLLS